MKSPMIRKYFSLLPTLVMVFLMGCSTVQNNRLPFSTFAGKEVSLVRPCILQEFVAGWEELSAFWEDGHPTEFVFDDRLFSKPAKTVAREFGDRSLYPVSDYSNRVYALRDSASSIEMSQREMYGGPYREYDLPQGTKVFIKKVYTFNGIDVVDHRVEGTVTIPNTSRRVKFMYIFDGFSSSGYATADEYIKRAPWEDESVPEERFVGLNGKMYNPKSPEGKQFIRR